GESMSAQALLDKLQAKGIDLRVAGDILRVRPAGVLTDEERAEIVAHRRDLMSLLVKARLFDGPPKEQPRAPLFRPLKGSEMAQSHTTPDTSGEVPSRPRQ